MKKIRTGVQSFDDTRRGLDHVNSLTPCNWTAYTPAVTATSGTPNLGTTGKKTLGWYSKNGAYCLATFYIVLGTGASFAGCGFIIISAPVFMVDHPSSSGVVGSAWVKVAGAYYPSSLWLGVGTGDIYVITSAGLVAAGVPGVWAAADELRGSVWYPIS